MSCNVGQYVPPGDCPDSQIERVLHLKLEVMQTSTRPVSRRRRSFAPGSRIELPVLSEEGHSLLLVGYRTKGELYAELHWDDIKIRALHTHPGHLNPGSRHQMADGHMHFPTSKYPLIGHRSSHAYEEDCDDCDDLNSFIEVFCATLNIELDMYQLVLEHGGR